MLLQRKQLHQIIDTLPDNLLAELLKFIEFLQYKWQLLGTSTAKPPYNPVDFPEGIAPELDLSFEEIKQARREMWGSLGQEVKV